jgi:hypothetical protein
VAVTQVRIQINGVWTTLTKSGGTWTGTVTAPSTTSFNQPGNVYETVVEATNSAGTKVTATSADFASLKLRVKETVKPTISITSPGSGAFVTNSQQPILFALRDESGGSGINLATLALKVDGGTAIGSSSSGMVCTAVSNGYDCVYTPPTALTDGSHAVTINVSDNDGNAATQASRGFKIDTQPPVLNVTNPANGLITNTAALTVQGSTNDATSSPVTVTVKLNSAAATSATVDGSGNFTKSLTLSEGANTIIVTATDAAGRQSVVTLSVTLDTTVPAISSVTITPNPANAGATLNISVVIT